MNVMKYCGIVLVLIVVGVGCQPPDLSSKPEASVPPTGRQGSDFSIPSLTGQVAGEISLASYKGQVVLLDFWATWCRPCRSELPALKRMYADLKGRGFALIGMTVDEGSRASVAAAVKPFNLTYPAGLAGPEVQAKYGGIRAVPTKFLVDKQGNVRQFYVGVVSTQKLRADVEQLLNE